MKTNDADRTDTSDTTSLRFDHSSIEITKRFYAKVVDGLKQQTIELLRIG